MTMRRILIELLIGWAVCVPIAFVGGILLHVAGVADWTWQFWTVAVCSVILGMVVADAWRGRRREEEN